MTNEHSSSHPFAQCAKWWGSLRGMVGQPRGMRKEDGPPFSCSLRKGWEETRFVIPPFCTVRKMVGQPSWDGWQPRGIGKEDGPPFSCSLRKGWEETRFVIPPFCTVRKMVGQPQGDGGAASGDEVKRMAHHFRVLYEKGGKRHALSSHPFAQCAKWWGSLRGMVGQPRGMVGQRRWSLLLGATREIPRPAG